MLTNKLVNLIPACIIFVDYSLSPEAKYPTALEECYAALCWTQQNAKSIHANIRQLVVMGDSAGGNLSTALTMLAKKRGNNGITYQMLFYPMTDTDITRDSYIEFKDDPVLGASFATYFWKQYLTDVDTINEATAVPLRGTIEGLKGLPPAFVLTCEKDVLRSEGELYASKLREANVNVIAIRYLGVNHGFLHGTTTPVETETAIMQIVDILKRHWQSYSSKI
ncbi:Alpha/beta hydrolase fold-3 [Choanephora cucurbitarum]|nr:Alpha/beta hydrolase fold-3 [Choanephora cucurbitarum]